MSKPSKSPTSPTLLWDVWGRAFSYSLLSFQLAPKGSSQPLASIPADLNQILQRLPHLLQILKPSGKGGIQSRGHSSPPATPGGTSSSVPWIYICGSPCFGNGFKLPTPGEGAAQALYFFFQGGCCSQSLPVGLSCLSRAPFCRGIPPPLLGVLLLRGQTSVGSGSPVVCGVLPLSASGSLLRRTTPLPQVLAPQEETLVASRACIPHSMGIWTPPCWSGALPGGWQIHLPWGPASEGHVSGLSRSYILPLSALALRHAGTSLQFDKMMGTVLFPSSLPLQE